jgi:hypothetical protein
MKKIFAIMALVCFLTGIGCAQEAPKHKKDGRSRWVMLELVIHTSLNGKTKTMSPVISIIDNRPGTIRIGSVSKAIKAGDKNSVVTKPSNKTTLNGKEVGMPNQPRSTDDFLTELIIKPTILDEQNPRMVKLRIDFSLKDKDISINKSFITTIVHQKTWEFEEEDPDVKGLTRLSIKATVGEPDESIKKDDKTGKYIIVKIKK